MRVNCTVCRGAGIKDYATCTACAGEGKVIGGAACLDCDGSGFIEGYTRCPSCTGTGIDPALPPTVSEQKPIHFRVADIQRLLRDFPYDTGLGGVRRVETLNWTVMRGKLWIERPVSPPDRSRRVPGLGNVSPLLLGVFGGLLQAGNRPGEHEPTSALGAALVNLPPDATLLLADDGVWVVDGERAKCLVRHTPARPTNDH